MPKHLKLLFSIVIFIACFAVAKTAYAVTEFVSIVDPDNGAGTSWTSLSAWEQNTQTDLSTSTTKVFSISSASGTFAVGSALVGYTSGATASSTYRTATQVLIYKINGIFQSGETVYIQVRPPRLIMSSYPIPAIRLSPSPAPALLPARRM